jgi:phenylalanyl-tRNA synthetase beta chain
VDFFDMKGAVELVVSGLGAVTECAAAEYPFLVRGRSARINLAASGHGVVGIIGEVTPAIATARDIPAGSRLYIAELDLDVMVDLTAEQPVTSVPPPRYPAVVRDVSIVVDDILPASAVRGTIRAAAPASLVDLREFDRYQGKGVPEGQVSLSYRLTFRAADRTLTDAEVQRAMDDILRALIAGHGAVQR